MKRDGHFFEKKSQNRGYYDISFQPSTFSKLVKIVRLT